MGEPAVSSPETTDSELMTRVRDGELERLADLFERHQRRLFNFFLRLTGDRSRAEDLVQEVFVRILKYRKSFKSEAEFTPWMFAMARNAAVDQYRRLPREVQENPEAPEPAAPIDPLEHPVARLEKKEQSELLSRALSRLAPEKRELLLLARFGEMRYEASGELLGVSVGAIKVRVHRALKDLRTAYRVVSEEGLA